MTGIGYDTALADYREAAPVDPDDVCVLAYTSGTTADPKGVLHSHRTLLAEMRHIRHMSGIAGPTLIGSPASHATGMLGGAARGTLYILTNLGSGPQAAAAKAGRIEAVEVEVPGAGLP